ncbi:MAG: exodeoxyribonuclease VII large subunit, partial [Magnetospirillum sp.]|nr:exodeoxyribonuclease VII large subunit [Magnetospirillum sp.]
YRSVLERGYAVVRGADGRPVSSSAAAHAGAHWAVEMRDGTVGVVVDASAPPAPPRKGRDRGDGRQGSLL